MNLAGKVALITGGRRVGADLAVRLADRGADVAMTYHTSRPAIEATVAEVERRGVRGLAIAANLSDPTQAERVVAEVIESFGRLDVLVNMASIFRRTPLAALTPADFDAMIAANLAAPYHTAIAASRRMLAQPGEDGIKGKIVNVGDWASNRPYRDYLPYLVAKGGLATFTKALAVELAPARHGKHGPARDGRPSAGALGRGARSHHRSHPAPAVRDAGGRQPADSLPARGDRFRDGRALSGGRWSVAGVRGASARGGAGRVDRHGQAERINLPRRPGRDHVDGPASPAGRQPARIGRTLGRRGRISSRSSRSCQPPVASLALGGELGRKPSGVNAPPSPCDAAGVVEYL